MTNNEIVIVGKLWWWDQNDFSNFVYEIIFMNIVKKLNKYCHEMSVTHVPVPLLSTIILYNYFVKNWDALKKQLLEKPHYHLW
jgi:hypothetical protein